METARAAALIIATVTTGLMAGVFAIFANAIMPGLRATDDKTFVGAFQSIDRAIVNPIFLATFFGALVASGLAAGLHVGRDHRTVLVLASAAFALYLAVVVVTMAVNLPLNDRIKAAGPVSEIADVTATRAYFNETQWARWNGVRVLLSTAAFGCLVWALVEFGRDAFP
jgi:uncharacterized membrane protein